MKLITCHIDNFGKLSNLDINFNEHVNIINQPNGWGKSTLAAFLCAMLYGFDNKKEAGAKEKDRKKYEPWQGGAYGGTISFEVNGRTYLVSRSFGQTEKYDEFHIYNGETNLECEDYSEKLGEELFDIDRASFKRTIFIGQNDCASSGTDSISAKLGNLAENTNDINNFESAQERIKDKMNKMAPNRITGSIKKRNNTIAQLQMDIKAYEAADKAMEELGEKLEERRAQKQELTDIRQDYAKALRIASEDSRKQELRKSYEALLTECQETATAYEEFRGKLPSVIPSDEEINEQLIKAKQLEEQSIISRNLLFTESEEETFSKLSCFRDGVPTSEEIEEKLEAAGKIVNVTNEHSQLEMKLSQMKSVAMLTDQEPAVDIPKKGKQGVFGIILIILGLIVVGLGATEGILWKHPLAETYYAYILIAGAVAAVLGVILVVVGKVKYDKMKLAFALKLDEREQQKKAKEEPIKELHSQLSAIEKGIETLKEEVLSFLSKYGVDCQPEEAQSKLYELRENVGEYLRLKEKEDKYKACEEQYDVILAELNSFARTIGISFSDEIAADLNDIKAKAAEFRFLQKQFEAAKLKKEQFEEGHEVEALLSPAECPYTIEELNSMIREVEAKAEDVQTGIEQYSRQIEDLQEQLDLRDDKLSELESCMELQALEQHQYDVLGLTKSYLQIAKEKFTARYMAPISDSFQKYYGILTRDESRNWVVDANINFKMREYGELRETYTLSAGYQDLVGVCMRFALVDAMYQGEKPFLILDDPLVNLDDEKLSHVEELLVELENDYQVIYFTCHNTGGGNANRG